MVPLDQRPSSLVPVLVVAALLRSVGRGTRLGSGLYRPRIDRWHPWWVEMVLPAENREPQQETEVGRSL